MDGAPASTGPFQISMAGALTDLAGAPKSTFHISATDLARATRFFVSIEPGGDTDPAPASVKPLAGDLNPSLTGAALSVNIPGKSFKDIAGAFVLATPSDGEGTHERSGLWFLAPYGDQPPVPGLVLPSLNGTEWVYEGWAVLNGTPVTTGRFDRADGADWNAPYSADGSTPPFPGEDFLQNSLATLSFPTDMGRAKAVVTIEPRDDPDPSPFQFKPPVADIPADAVDHLPYNMTGANGTLPTGSVVIAAMGANPPSAGLGSNALAMLGLLMAVALVIAFVALRRRGSRGP